MLTSGENWRIKMFDVQKRGFVGSAIAHTGRVHKAAWSPDEKQFITVGSDGCVCVWNFYG